MVLLAQTPGYANLCRLITDAHMTGERGDPALRRAQVCAHAAGLMPPRPARRAPGGLAVAGRIDAARRAARPLREAFGATFRRGPAPTGARGSDEIRACSGWPTSRASRAVATNAVRYLVPEDAFLADVLECMREIVPLAANHVSRANAEG